MTRCFASDRAARLRLMGFDVDGVLTDGTLFYSASGEEAKAFSVRDGHGLKMLQAAGVELALITARSSRAVALRAEDLGIRRLVQGAGDKRAALAGLAAELGLDLAQVGYMGDDLVDLPALRSCGFAATVSDGHWLVRRHVHYVSRLPGGRGAVREVCEFILRSLGELDRALGEYLE